jgi:hypothetical protein
VRVFWGGWTNSRLGAVSPQLQCLEWPRPVGVIFRPSKNSPAEFAPFTTRTGCSCSTAYPAVLILGGSRTRRENNRLEGSR